MTAATCQANFFFSAAGAELFTNLTTFDFSFSCTYRLVNVSFYPAKMTAASATTIMLKALGTSCTFTNSVFFLMKQKGNLFAMVKCDNVKCDNVIK